MQIAFCVERRAPVEPAAPMKRKPILTKRERKAVSPARPSSAQAHDHQHIHCISCGRHLDPAEFETGTATALACQHGSQFPSCVVCTPASQRLLDEHDASGQPVKVAGAWH
jgi:hypothetical protein